MNSVAFAPDGHTLATASTDNTFHPTVILWDLTNRTQPRRLDPPALMSWVAFTPDGHTLATASGDATVILWDFTAFDYLLDDDHAVERACSFARGGFDQGEWERRIPDLPYQDTCPT